MSGQSGGGIRGRLTSAFIRKISAPGRYHDGSGLGLMLRVMPSGSRQWVQRIMIGGKRVELGLGSPPIVTLQAARDRALENKRAAYGGQTSELIQTPVHSPVPDVPTFEQVAAKTASIYAVGKSKSAGTRFIGALNLHVFPRIGNKKVNTITSGDLNELLTTLIYEKPTVAAKVKLYVNHTMKWCVGNGLIDRNPLDQAKISLPKIVTSDNHRVSLQYQNVHNFIVDLKQSGAKQMTKLGLEFLILCASRSGEVRGAVWEEIDLNDKLWKIPKERMKGRKKSHIVPLSGRAIEILEEVGPKSSGLVFPSPNNKILSDMTYSKLTKKTLGYDVDIHGFRTSFRTWAQEKTTFSEDACELALAHTVGSSVRRAYARSELLEERALLMEAWAGYLASPPE